MVLVLLMTLETLTWDKVEKTTLFMLDHTDPLRKLRYSKTK